MVHLFSVATLYTYANKNGSGLFFHLSLDFIHMSTSAFSLLPLAFISSSLKYWQKNIRKSLLHHPVIQSFGIITLAVMPWIIKIVLLSKQLANSWYFPVNFQLVLSGFGQYVRRIRRDSVVWMAIHEISFFLS